MSDCRCRCHCGCDECKLSESCNHATTPPNCSKPSVQNEEQCKCIKNCEHCQPQQDTWEERKTGKLVGVCNGKPHCDLEKCNTEHDERCEHDIPKWEMTLRELGFIHPPLIQFIKKQKQLSEQQGYQRGLQDFYEAVDKRYKDFEITVAMGKVMKELMEKLKNNNS